MNLPKHVIFFIVPTTDLIIQVWIIKVLCVSTAMWGDIWAHKEDVYQVITA